MMKYYLCFSVTVLLLSHYVECMTEAQIRNAVKLVRNVCQPKSKVTNAQVDEMHKGNFPDDNKLACYMNCALHALKFMKNGQVDYDFAMTQIKSLPANLQAPFTHSIQTCKEAAQSSDRCEASYQVAQCIYKAEPDYYFLP